MPSSPQVKVDSGRAGAALTCLWCFYVLITVPHWAFSLVLQSVFANVHFNMDIDVDNTDISSVQLIM